MSDRLLPRALVAALLADAESVAQLRAALREPGSADAVVGPPAYPVDTLAATLGLTPRAVRNAIARRELQAVKRGGRWLIPPDAVDAWTHESHAAGRFVRRPQARHQRPQPLHDALRRLDRA